MTGVAKNPNMKRRGGPGLLANIVAPLLKPWLKLLQKNDSGPAAAFTAFQSYLVGDLFMALPALKALAHHVELTVICRPDCAGILRAEGLNGIPFDNAFQIKPGLGSFLDSWRSAWKLRGRLGALSLDFDADPRTAFWLKVAGVKRTVSYHRFAASLFDELLPLPLEAIHQADRDMAVARAFLESETIRKRVRVHGSGKTDSSDFSFPPPTRTLNPNPEPDSPWLISCWTRKDTKNWPLARWDEFLERLLAERVPFRILNAPDGNMEFRTFRARWSERVEFLEDSLTQIARAVQTSKGVVATDNFIGHMAGYYRKPVLWINGSSDPRQVRPKGPQTQGIQVDPMPCRPCGHRCVNAEYKACLTKLSVNSVWRAFEALRATRINPADAPAA